MAPHVLTELTDGILTLRLNRPEKKNALTRAMYTAMAEACRTIEMDQAVRVLVITGSGDAFTAGNDLNDFLEDPPTYPEAPAFVFMRALAHLSKPVIAAVNGMAIGIGTTMLPHCDFAYAVPGARFQMPFVNLAIVPEYGSTFLLQRFVGARRATELLLTGESFTADSALADGLLTGIVPAESLMEMAMTQARTLCAKPPSALRETKRLLRSDLPEILAHMTLEERALAVRFASTEFKAAVEAFFAKREG
jgi:enoyl-CoA hydratase/carnithine racemase